MFTKYHSWYKATQNSYDLTLFPNSATQLVKMSLTINLLLKDKKGTKHLREVFDKANTQKCIIGQGKLVAELYIDESLNWTKLYTMASKCNLDARLRYFNFQVLHKTLITNKKFKLFNISDNDTCDNCTEVDTTSHRLYDCTMIQPLWLKLRNW